MKKKSKQIDEFNLVKKLYLLLQIIIQTLTKTMFFCMVFVFKKTIFKITKNGYCNSNSFALVLLNKNITMKKLRKLITLFATILLTVSCSKKEIKVLVVKSIKTTHLQTAVYKNLIITKNPKQLVLYPTPNNSKIKITVPKATVFKKIAESKKTTIDFSEQGLKSYKTVEEIKIKIPPSNNTLKTLETPKNDINSTDELYESTKYLPEEIRFTIKKNTQVV